MESVYVRQRLRPCRYAFLIKEEDRNSALQAASINCALWGGIYNPIVPILTEESRNGLLKAFDPDFLVNLAGDPISSELGDRFKNRIIQASDLVTNDGVSGRRRLKIGFRIPPVLYYLHDKEIRFLNEESRAAIVLPEDIAGWPEFTAFAFGSFRWLPEMDFDFESIFTQALRARKIELPNNQSPANFEELIFPINMTGYGLRQHARRANFSTHIIFIGNHQEVSDLIEFWNIRATGRTVVFVPISSYKAFEPLIRYIAGEGRLVNDQSESRADLQKGISISDSFFNEVGDWINTLALPPISRRSWRPRYGLEDEFYIGDIHASDIEAREGEEISMLQDSKMTPVKIIRPPYLQEQTLGFKQFVWSVELDMSGAWQNEDLIFFFPQEPAVETVLRTTMVGREPGHIRIGRRGIVIQEDSARSIFYPKPIATRDVFSALFEQVGLSSEPSEPGQYAHQIIKKMGGSVQFDCRVFKIRGVREILDKLGNGDILTKGNMCQIVMSKEADSYGQNWRPELYQHLYISQSQRRGQVDFGTIFDVLLEKQIIRPGFEFKCKNCFKQDWYHVSQFDEKYICRYCFSSQRVNFASVREWQYKADGLFRIPDSALGSVAVIISIWRLDELKLSYKNAYITSQNLTASDGARYEIDYAFLAMETSKNRYSLVLGYASRFADITDDEVRRAIKVADSFPIKPYLAFTTLKDRFSDDEKRRLKDLSSRGYSVIVFTREELDPYDLHKRFENIPHRYAHDLKQLSENTVKINLSN